ncbi:insulin-like growth factor-binding protein complex acid labile subunit [Branchiostoma floridae]|uniref:Insulin-like growth factor-binding protein complex acid labile subunit n=1 Tax=Branchiostoma floridae TaxID=7739 RepID=A0A9J7M1N3_BRAFL|nr:insulin-like growth factor-binding protein complex acid labile subunit [Branchiostoma floridae]
MVRGVSTLWLRGYRLGYLSPSDVTHIKHIQNLYIEPGDIEYLENNTFADFESLYNLSLAQNKLRHLEKIVALCYFVLAMVRKRTPHKQRDHRNNGQDQRDNTEYSQNTDKIVEDQPSLAHQYEVILDRHQADMDSITPYGQAAACHPGRGTGSLPGEVCVICNTSVEHRPRDTVPRCTLLEEATILWLKNYRLGYLSSADINHLKHLTDLIIEPGNLVLLDNETFEGFEYKLYNLSLSRNNLPYLGKGWLVEVLGHLNLAHNKIAYIEDEAFGTSDHCLATAALFLSWNKLVTVKPGYFRHLCKLMVLDLRHNQISTIDGGDLQYLETNTFDGFTSLYNLSLSRNRLTYLGKRWLVEVGGHLTLTHNEIAFIEDEAFGTYDVQMVALHLAWNKLDVIEAGYFRYLGNVRILDLRHNKIHTIGKVALSCFLILLFRKGTYKIWKVDNVQDQNQNVDPDRLSQHTYETVEDQYEVIRDSQMEEDDVITPYGQATMAGAYGMDTEMTAAVRDLQYLENNTFDGFTSLYNLSLSHNRLTYLGKRWLVQVGGHLSLTHNEIAFIEDEAFGAYELDTVALHLAWNKLDVIEAGYFKYLWNIRILDLSYNKIHTIDKGSFNDLQSLRVLRLDGNNLRVGTYKIWKVDNVQDQNQNVDPDRLSQHAYETVEDQYEVIRDSQIEEDDVITPYGQATMAGAYGMDTPMTAAPCIPSG